MLKFYDSESTLVAGPLHGYVDGVSGGVYDLVLWVRNDDTGFVYTDVYVQYLEDGSTTCMTELNTVAGLGIVVKMAKSTKPTEIMWAALPPASSIQLEDIGIIGETNTPDTASYQPVYVRIYCPAGTPTQIMRDHSLRIIATPIGV